MSELSLYYKKLYTIIEAGSPVWQASVIETDGSTPARVGMKLAVPQSGDCFGNLGGGEMEYLVINTIRKEQPKYNVKWTYSLDEQGKTVSNDSHSCESENHKGTPSSEVRPSRHSCESGNLKGTPSSEVRQTGHSSQSVNLTQTRMICGGNVEVLIEPLFAAHPLYIIGAGHCGRALAEFAVKTDFQVTVIDNRQDLLQADAFPAECKLVYNDYDSLDTVIHFNANAFVVIMTYGHVHDRQVLEYCLKHPFLYLGMIGSKKKVAETMERVKSNGFSDEELKKVHAPIGLPIHSHTPYEIAISILGELITIKNSV